MRLLSFSLIFAILLTIVGSGWLISWVYSHLAPQTTDTKDNYIIQSWQSMAAIIDTDTAYIQHIPAGLEAKLIETDDLPLPAPLQQTFMRSGHIALGSDKGLRHYLYLPQQQRILVVNAPNDSLNVSFWQLSFTIIFYVAVLLAMLLWLSPLLRHLLRLRNAAKQFGEGQLDQRVTITRWSYIKEIETAFNHMAEQINRLLDDNKLLSRAISHELKNPLARLRLGVDVLSETASEKQLSYIQRINGDLDEMQSLIHNLLQYSQLDSNRIALSPEPIELNQFCTEQLAAYEWYQKDIQWVANDSDLVVTTDKQHLALIVNNLVTNALNHGGGRLRVSLANAASVIELTVEDDGDGIPESERQEVFELFHRNRDASNAKGHGIGLASVARACDWLGMRIALDQSPTLGGARFRLFIAEDTKRYS